MKQSLVLVMLCALLTSCSDTYPYYKCLRDEECVDFDLRHGRCLNSQFGPFCAYADMSCSTMWRWDQAAYPGLKNECILPAVPLDAAVDLVPVDMSPSPTG